MSLAEKIWGCPGSTMNFLPQTLQQREPPGGLISFFIDLAEFLAAPGPNLIAVATANRLLYQAAGL